MKPVALGIVVVMTMGVSICWGQTRGRAEDYYQRGLTRQEKGDMEGAIADFFNPKGNLQ